MDFLKAHLETIINLLCAFVPVGALITLGEQMLAASEASMLGATMFFVVGVVVGAYSLHRSGLHRFKAERSKAEERKRREAEDYERRRKIAFEKAEREIRRLPFRSKQLLYQAYHEQSFVMDRYQIWDDFSGWTAYLEEETLASGSRFTLKPAYRKFLDDRPELLRAVEE